MRTPQEIFDLLIKKKVYHNSRAEILPDACSNAMCIALEYAYIVHKIITEEEMDSTTAKIEKYMSHLNNIHNKDYVYLGGILREHYPNIKPIQVYKNWDKRPGKE